MESSEQTFGELRGDAGRDLKGLGGVCFHLAENKNSDERPFAFLATVERKGVAGGRDVHVPLGKALKEVSQGPVVVGTGASKDPLGARDNLAEGAREELRRILKALSEAAARSSLVAELLESRKIFAPQFWTADEAYQFLNQARVCEEAGILVRVPDWWRMRKVVRPRVEVTVGEGTPSLVGIHAMLGFKVKMSLGEQELSRAEWEELLAKKSGLVRLRGQWVDLDGEKLRDVLRHWQLAERASTEGFSFLDGMRLLAGFPRFVSGGAEDVAANREHVQVVAGEWLGEVLAKLRDPSLSHQYDPGEELRATLRPYQKLGVSWLWQTLQLGLGACLADDMGLGKTIQVLGYLLLRRRQAGGEGGRKKSLLVVPASLMGNWQREAEKFAPVLKLFVYHPSFGCGLSKVRPGGEAGARLDEADAVVTTYGALLRADWLAEENWGAVICDEAQNIKNPGSQQTMAVKQLRADHRIALTGTPIENRLTDLWSICDYLTPGMLGSADQFRGFVSGGVARMDSLRELVSPYILRRLKTDKTIISDLPDKVEVNSWCFLGKEQATIYRASVDELVKTLKEVDGIERKGIVLSFLMRFKQICDHPSLWLGDGVFKPEDSGKFARLREICEQIVESGEKVLVFTQFKEMTDVLQKFLSGIFGRPGLVLTGSTAVKRRQTMVDEFQASEGAGFFVISLKAGGTGLNLTAASHVIHFDRWWNPAVENQATDRAFRIGQKRNVMVHKFVCRGTIEERIDEMIMNKTALAEQVLGGGSEIALTEMGDEELLRLVSLGGSEVGE